MNPIDILQNTGNLKENMDKIQDELRNLTAVGSAGGNLVQITINGAMEIEGVKLDPLAVDPRDITMLEALIVAALNDAHKNIKDSINKNITPFTMMEAMRGDKK